jgi:YD repeat-containing protein
MTNSRIRVIVGVLVTSLLAGCTSDNHPPSTTDDEAAAETVTVTAPASCAEVGCAGEGIDTSTGSFRSDVTDLIFPPGLFGVEIARSYRSDDDHVGWFGRGWSTVYETSIAVSDDGLVVDAPVGLAPLWTPEAPNGWDVTGGLNVAAAGDGYTIEWPTGETWTFDASGALHSVASPYGATVTITATTGQVELESSQGVTVTFAMTSGRVTGAESSDGRTVAYEYTNDTLTSMSAPGLQLGYRYDNTGRLTELEAPGGITANIYEAGRVAGQRTASEIRLSVTYEPDAAVVETPTDTVTYHHDPAGRLDRITIDDKPVLEQTFDELGRLVARTELAQPSGETVMSLERTFDGDQLTAETVNGSTTEYIYDGSGRVTAVAGPTPIELEYTSTDPLPAASTMPGSGRSEFAYENGFVVSVVDATGAASLTERDELGNPVANGPTPDAQWSFNFDAEGNVTVTTSPAGRTWTATWDPRHALRTETDPLGRTTSYRYDPGGRLLAQTEPGGGTTSRTYTDAGLLASVTEPDGAATRYEYDATGRVATIVQPGDRTWRLTYEPAGNGAQTVTTTGADGARIVTRIDSAGRETRRQAIEADGTVTETVAHTYDHGQIAVSTVTRGTSSYITTNTFDAAGRPTAVSASLDDATPTTISYEYDGGLVTSITNGADTASYDYDPAGRLIHVTAGDDVWDAAYTNGVLVSTGHNGITTRIERDPDGRATAFIDPDGATTTWRYDDADRPTARSISEATATFEWDDADRLTTYTAPTGATWAWSYDPTGRLLTATEPGDVNTTYEYELGAVSRIRTTGRGHDRDDRFQYDGRGLLRAAQTGTGRFEYTYDATDRIVRIDSNRDNDDETWTLNAAGQIAGVDSGGNHFDLAYTPLGQVDAITGPGDELLDADWDAGHLTTVKVDESDPIGIAVDEDGRLTSVTWNADTAVDVTWQGDESFSVGDRGTDNIYDYTVTDGRLTSFTHVNTTFTASGDTNAIDLLTLVSDTIDGEVRFDQHGRPAVLHDADTTATITYDPSGRAASVLTNRPDGEVSQTTVTYNDDGARQIDGDGNIINALFDNAGSLRQSLPGGLANPLSAGAGSTSLQGALLTDDARELLAAQPNPLALAGAAVVIATPQLTAPVGVRDRRRLAHQLVAAEANRLAPIIAISGGLSVQIPIINPDNGHTADYNPFVDATPAGLALGALARQAGGGGSLLDRAVNGLGDTVGGIVSIGADVARFVVTNPIARLVLSTASVVAAGAACAATGGVPCAPLAALAVGLLVGDASLTLANTIPALVSDCSGGRLAACGLNVAYTALAGVQLMFAGTVATSLLRVADRAVTEAFAEGGARWVAMGESGVARSELLEVLRGGQVVRREVPACVAGVEGCVRLDLVVRRIGARLTRQAEGFTAIEVKNGAMAQFTPNQLRIYPMLAATAAYFPDGIVSGASPQTLLIGRPVVQHWNTNIGLSIP